MKVLLPIVGALLYHLTLTTALITLDTIRNLTALTDDARLRIVDLSDLERGVGVSGRVLGERGNGQAVLIIGRGEDEGEVEDTVAAALRLLCSDLLVELEKPFKIVPPPATLNEVTGSDCHIVKEEYHNFLAATVKFLYVVQERQMLWRWDTESTVFNGVSWMQSLWASRTANSENRSFIEQQMSLYASTECFGKSKEVLRRDVEVVEYLNDLLDSF